VAANVPRLSLLVFEASVSLKPCFLSLLANLSLGQHGDEALGARAA
jgi:hypothetical protein